jgi:hypothetical protein
MDKELTELLEELESKFTYEERVTLFYKIRKWFLDKDNNSYLLELMKDAINHKDYNLLMILLIILQPDQDKRFTEVLCDILKLREYNFMEGAADVLYDIADENSIETVIEILEEYIIDDDLGYHLRIKLFDILFRINTGKSREGIKSLLNSNIEQVREIAHKFNQMVDNKLNNIIEEESA